VLPTTPELATRYQGNCMNKKDGATIGACIAPTGLNGYC
jgi:hypothetical protein